MIISLAGILQSGIPLRAMVATSAAQTINLPQGTNASITIRITTPDGSLVDLSDVHTKVQLAVRRQGFPYDYPRIDKTATIAANMATITIIPADTRDMYPGRYFYDVWLTKDGLRDEVVPMSTFQILPAVGAPP